MHGGVELAGAPAWGELAAARRSGSILRREEQPPWLTPGPASCQGRHQASWAGLTWLGRAGHVKGERGATRRHRWAPSAAAAERRAGPSPEDAHPGTQQPPASQDPRSPGERKGGCLEGALQAGRAPPALPVPCPSELGPQAQPGTRAALGMHRCSQATAMGHEVWAPLGRGPRGKIPGARLPRSSRLSPAVHERGPAAQSHGSSRPRRRPATLSRPGWMKPRGVYAPLRSFRKPLYAPSSGVLRCCQPLPAAP